VRLGSSVRDAALVATLLALDKGTGHGRLLVPTMAAVTMRDG
jgi:hypothetical protein